MSIVRSKADNLKIWTTKEVWQGFRKESKATLRLACGLASVHSSIYGIFIHLILYIHLFIYNMSLFIPGNCRAMSSVYAANGHNVCRPTRKSGTWCSGLGKLGSIQNNSLMFSWIRYYYSNRIYDPHGLCVYCVSLKKQPLDITNLYV